MNYAIHKVDCHCNPNGCQCNDHAIEKSDLEPILEVDQKCYCNDPEISERLKLSIELHLFRLFSSQNKLRRVFGKKLACFMNGVKIQTHVALLCNPPINEKTTMSALHRLRPTRRK